MDAIRVLALGGEDAERALIRGRLQEIEDPIYTVDGIADFDAGREALLRDSYDVFLVDQRVGAREGLALLREASAEGRRAPMFLLAGEHSRELSRAAVEAGATDCLVKRTLTGDALDRAIRYGIREHRLTGELQEARDQLRQLHGIIPICMYCHRLKSENGCWQRPDDYLEEHAGASMSHGICPCCWKETVAPHLEELGCEDLEY